MRDPGPVDLSLRLRDPTDGEHSIPTIAGPHDAKARPPGRIRYSAVERVIRSCAGWLGPTPVVEPYLQPRGSGLYNPLTCLELSSEDPLWQPVASLYRGDASVADLPKPVRRELESRGWIVCADPRLFNRYRLRCVSLETHTVCNHRCYFCPVSVSPRDPYFMPDQLFARITGELAGHLETIEAIFLNNYNEPTVDRRFVDQCRALMGAGFPVAIATNGSGLTPDRVDDILREGRLRYLGFNLSTVDRGRYRRDRGVDHLDTVLRNIEHAGRHQIAEEMAIVVLGLGDEAHREEFERIQQRFEGSRYQVRRESVMNRAGNIDIGLAVGGPKRRLSGCENIGSRPVQHLHITAHGSCLLCCQDYFEQYPVGDLTTSSIHDVMSGEALSRYRRWVYGAEETPDDFICNRCVSAISAPARCSGKHRKPDDSQPVDQG